MKVKLRKVPADGDCFYHAIAEHIDTIRIGSVNVKASASLLRRIVGKKMKKYIEENNELRNLAIPTILDENMTLNEYVKQTKNGMWAGPIELMILAKALNVRIQVYDKADMKKQKGKIYKLSKEPIMDIGDKRKTPMMLTLHGVNKGGRHYDVIQKYSPSQ